MPCRPNAGNLLIIPNDRTKKMMKLWLAKAFDQKGEFRVDIHDQHGLWNVSGEAWQWCGRPANCAEVKKKGVAAMWLHSWHGCPWEHFTYDPAKNHWKGICDNRFPYLHIFCTAGEAEVHGGQAA